MAPKSPMLGIYLTVEEYAQLAEEAKTAGFRSPALYLRALWRETLHKPEWQKLATASKAVQDQMMNNAAKMVVDYLRTITPEELLNAIQKPSP